MKKKQHKGVKVNQTNLGKEISLSGCVFFFWKTMTELVFKLFLTKVCSKTQKGVGAQPGA